MLACLRASYVIRRATSTERHTVLPSPRPLIHLQTDATCGDREDGMCHDEKDERHAKNRMYDVQALCRAGPETSVITSVIGNATHEMMLCAA